MPGKNFLPLLCAALFCRFAGSLRIDNTTSMCHVPAGFGPMEKFEGPVVPATPADGCQAFAVAASADGQAVLLDRGNCEFFLKVRARLHCLVSSELSRLLLPSQIASP